MKPLCIDLFCGLGGWADGFLSEGWDVIGFDIERHDYGTGGYPGQLVLQDVLTLHGSQFRNAAVIVASPPCQAYSYRAMPWTRAKALPPPSNELFEACFRIQRESGGVPLVVENVRGAQRWVGRAKWHYGSFYLWGDVPALMPSARALKVPGFNFHGHEKGIAGGSFQTAAVKVAHNKTSGHSNNARDVVADGLKVPGMNWSNHGDPDYKPKGFNVTAAQRYRAEQSLKGPGGDWFKDGRQGQDACMEGIKQHGSGPAWFDNGISKHSSRSNTRKAASAQIAKIPLPLSQHIARVYKPVERVAALDRRVAI